MTPKKYGLSWIYGKTRGVRLALAAYTLLALCIPVIQLLVAYFMKLFIDIATGSLAMPLPVVGLRTIATIAAGGVVIMLSPVLSKWIYGKIECGARAELMEVIFSRRMIDIAKQHTGELLTKLTTDVQAVSMCVTGIIDNMVGGLASAVLATAALFFLSWKIAVILLILTPALMFLMGVVTPHIQKASANDKRNDEANRSMLQESLSRIMLVKTYSMQEKNIGKAQKAYEGKLKSGMELGMWEGLAGFAGVLFGNVISLVTLGVGSYFVLTGETTVGSLIMMVQLLNYIVNPISKLPEAIAQTSQAVVSAGRIGTVYELPADERQPALPPVDATELAARDLSFSYNSVREDGGRETLLNGVSLWFTKGEIGGIAGQSGSGKSTLLKLLIGLYTPNKGTVTLKHPSGILSGEEIMGQVAYVPSADYLFSGSVADNIIMAEQEARLEEMRTAAAGANILTFIESLPQGFETPVGEGGGTVSSGQAQRIAIARAIYKKACVIVFDEPTANLDADSIGKFQEVLRRIAMEKICILVTHDPSTAAICDKLYVLENGVVREKPKGQPLPIKAAGERKTNTPPKER